MAEEEGSQKEAAGDITPSQGGYYDAETADKCKEVSTQHNDFYQDLETRFEQRRQAQLDTSEKLNAFKTTLDLKIQGHLSTFDNSD